MLDGRNDALRRLQGFSAPRLPRLGHGQQNAVEARSPVSVLAGKICSPEERLSSGSQYCRHRPAPLPTDRGNRSLIAAVNVRPLVAIDLDGDEMLVDEIGQI